MNTTTQASVILRHLRTLVAKENTGGLTDRQLLEQFAARHEDAAFAALVQRYAPLVLGVCRRVLRSEHDAEDAFQATFLVLARKAREVGKQGSVAGWLHQVAYRAALKARAQKANRQQHERLAPPRQSADPLAEVTGRELLAVLDEELQRLPDTSRSPLVLCYLQGCTCDSAARQIGCSVRTFKRRLEAARQLLRSRLARRGIALPAALLALGLTQEAKAAVPPALLGAAVAGALAVVTGTGRVAPAAAALAQQVLRTSGPSWTKLGAAVLLVGTLTLALGGLVSRGAPPQPAVAPPEQPQRAESPTGDSPDKDKDKTALAGRVLNAEGKPVAGALVAAYAGLEFGSLSVQYQARPLGEVKTDADGRFRLPIPTTSGEHIRHVELLVGASGFGPTWRQSAAFGGPDVELRLPPEEVVVARLMDLQGEPAANVSLRPVRVYSEAAKPPIAEKGAMKPDRMKMLEDHRRPRPFEFSKDSPIKDSALWPANSKTDKDGRVRLGGFGHGQEVHLVVEDERFARQEIVVVAGAREERFGLLPPHKVAGRIVTADTDKPVANAWIGVTSFHDHLGHLADVRTDADGRFSTNAYPGESYSVEVYPQGTEPYVGAYHSADWPRGAVRQEVNLKLPRGVVVRGKVVEAGTGKPLLSAAVAFLPQTENNPERPRNILTGPYHRAWTAADGTFQMVFPPGRGHLVVTGPNPDYAYATISESELRTGKPGGPPQHFHAILPLELRASDDPREAKVELRRSVTIAGRLVGPDGKPVKDAVVFVPSELLPPSPERGLALAFGVPFDAHLAALAARDGAFELPNCDPDKTYRLYVQSGRAEGGMMISPGLPRLDTLSVVNRLLAGKNPLGAVADLSAKAADGKPVEIKLAACESADVRFVDATGKGVRQKVWLELLVKPGPTVEKSQAEGKPAAEGALLGTPYSLTGEKSPVAADAEGRLTIPGLIPGATYRLKVLIGTEGRENETLFVKDFTVEAGKQTKLELVAPEAK